MNNIFREQENRHWIKNENVYELHFRPYYDDEIILKFIQDKEDSSIFIYVSDMLNVEHDEIITDSVEEAMEEFEYMIEEHLKGEIDYYEEILRKFKEDSVGDW